jgi:(R,R)-butanediol dehydrogenase/meso-butanediol dehydrogenase/diacetyl reductase/L-iditol 2-dehydrogenase
MKVLSMTERGNPKEGTLGKLELLEAPIPEPKGEEILIKIQYSSICGSDPHILRGLLESSLPTGMGHEMSGIIEKLGPGATRKGFQVGDKVTGNFLRFCGTCFFCRNGQENLCPELLRGWNACQAEYVIWHESQAYKVPDGVDMLDASLTEPCAISLRMVEKSKLRIGNRMAVIGGGGIGQLVSQIARISGASSVTLVEPVEQKREIAESAGIDHTLDPTDADYMDKAMKITQGRGFDNIIETSGNSKAAEQALALTARGGHIVYPAMYSAVYDMPLNLYRECYLNEKTIHGCLMSPYSFPRTVQLLPRLQLKPLIQRLYPLSDYQKAYDDAVSGNVIKVVFDLTK